MAPIETRESLLDDTETLDIEQRTTTIIITEILLRPEQIKPFKEELEKLRKKYMKMD